MAYFNFNNLAANLPDALRKDKDSNNYKLLLVEQKIYNRILEIFQDVEKCLDVDNCNGTTLDYWGKRWQVARGTATNEQYKMRIKAKIGQSFCDGSRDSIANAIGYMLSYDPNKIKLTSSKNNVITVVDIPYETIRKAGFTDEQVAEIINDLVPTGVSVEINFSGTFELGETWGEQDAEKGLSDLDRTVGGYLGMVRR